MGNTGIWNGVVTEANNGGFVGIRSNPFRKGMDMSTCKGVQLKLRKGDRKRFKFVTRDSPDFNGVCWTTAFDAVAPNLFFSNEKMITVRIPFDKQVPTIFANIVNGKTFNEQNVMGFQFAYSKFEYGGQLNTNFATGEFTLQILELRAY